MTPEPQEAVEPPVQRRSYLRRIESSEMGSAPVLRTLITLGIPAATAGIMQTSFEFVDTLFVSRLGKEAVSGVSLVGPLMFLMFAITTAVNVGVSALLARRLGERKLEQARRVLSWGLVVSAIVGIALTVLSLAFLDQLLGLLGGHADIVPYARQFGQIMLLGMLSMHLGTTADAALRAQGDTVTPMKVSLWANVVNAALNWYFIFGLGLGVQGSALGTLITRTLISLILLSRLWARSTEVRPVFPYISSFRDGLRTIGEIYWIGLPASVGMAAMAGSMWPINRLLVDLNPYAVGVLGIGIRVESLAMVPVFGLFSAVVPMMAYNYGARSIARCREVMWTSAWLSAVVMGTGGLAIFAFPAEFFGLFVKDPEMLPMGVEYLRALTPVYPLVAASIMVSAGFQGIGKTWAAMVLHLWRNVIIKLPLAYWFAALWGVSGVWWSFPVSSLASAGFSFAWMYLELRRLDLQFGQALEQETPTEAIVAPVEAEAPVEV